MGMECPGRRSVRNLESMVLRCPSCDKLVEMFSDEQKARCSCGGVILREAVPSCIQWCPAAERCMGAVVDLREVRKRIAEMHSGKEADELVSRVSEMVREAKRSGRCDNDQAKRQQKSTDAGGAGKAE